jgi:hypothetical protein
LGPQSSGTSIPNNGPYCWLPKISASPGLPLEIVDLPLPRARRGIRAERPWADITRSRIGADQIGLGCEPDLEAPGLDRRESEMPVRADDAQRPIRRTLVLDR